MQTKQNKKQEKKKIKKDKIEAPGGGGWSGEGYSEENVTDKAGQLIDGEMLLVSHGLTRKVRGAGGIMPAERAFV